MLRPVPARNRPGRSKTAPKTKSFMSSRISVPLCASIVAALAFATCASAATLTFYANKDVAAKENHPDTNFGTEANMRISAKSGEHKEGFIQFTVSGIPAGATNITAQLKCAAQTTGTGRAISARAVSNTSWNELTVTWNTGKPSLGATLDTVSNHTSGTDTVWDLGGYVTGNSEVAVGLSSAFAGDTIFTSREGVAGTATDPRLIVTYTVANVVSIATTDASAAETGLAPATFQVTSSSAAPAGGLVVNYTISGSAQKNDNASATPDYIVSPSNGTATTGSVTIPAGATTANVTVTPIQDSHFEGPETVIFTLASGSGYSVGAARAAQAVIADNEPAPSVNPDHAAGEKGGWIMPVSGILANNECSGMAASRNYPGVIWYQRDGNPNEAREKMYAIEASHPTNNGTLLKTIDLNQPAGWTTTWHNSQWEDMTIDPDAPNHIWIADIGNNNTPPTRNAFNLFRITEPNPYGSATSATPTAFYGRYPGGLEANAEIMFMFEGLAHIILKENNPRIYRAPSTTLSTDKANPTVFEYVGTVVGGGNIASVGTLSWDRRRFAIATRFNGLWVWVSQSSLDPRNNILTPAQAMTYIQDLLCTRNPIWALAHNGGSADPENQVGSVEGGTFIGDGHDVILGAEGRNVVPVPAWWYETQPAPIPTPPAAPTVNNRAPDVVLTSPAGGATISKAATPSVTLQAVASDYDGTVASVRFYHKLSSAPSRTLIGNATSSGGAWQITWNFSGAATGSYTLSADATDNSGAVASASISITLNP